MPIKLIIFDLDGTLIDSSRDITDAINYAIGPYGLSPLTTKDTIKLVGEGISRLIEKLLSTTNFNGNDDVRRTVMDRFLEYYSAHLLDNTDTYPNVRLTLERLREYKKAVISNKREALSRRILEGLGLSNFFDAIIGSDSTPEKKPSPLPILKVLAELDVKPQEAIIVGDSNLDIEAGRAAGLRTVSVTYGYRPYEMIKDADFVIDRLGDLEEIIKMLDK
ncbi:MAG: HAD family hydrolase [Thermodesulfovibrionales bacterium]